MTRGEFLEKCDLLRYETKYSARPWDMWLTEMAAHDAEQRQTIEQQAQEIARLREALKDKEDTVRHLMVSIMQLVTIVRGSIITSDVTQGILFKAEHLLKVLGEQHALKE